jgi:hypothetical protein
LAEPGLFGIDTVDHANRDWRTARNLQCALLWRRASVGWTLWLQGRRRFLPRRRRILRLTRRRWCRILGREFLSTAELQTRYVGHVEGVYPITDGHPDLAGVASQVLAAHHSAAAKRE